MGRGDSTSAENILYGRLPAANHPKSAVLSPLNPISLETSKGYFEGYSGWSGALRWAAKAPELPAEWKPDGDEAKGENYRPGIKDFTLKANFHNQRWPELEAVHLEPFTDQGQEMLSLQRVDQMSFHIDNYFYFKAQIQAVEELVNQPGEWMFSEHETALHYVVDEKIPRVKGIVFKHQSLRL